jgi:uncharacterized tellurite resistance protein B-like protein
MSEMDLRLARLHLLAQVLEADGIVTESEHAFLDRHMTAQKLSREERGLIRGGKGRAEAMAFLRGLSTGTRTQLVQELAEAALADGKLSPLETNAIKKLAEALGLN